VTVGDTTSASAPQLPPNVFMVTPPQPLVTSGLSQNGDKGFAQDGRNYTTSATDAAVAGVGPQLAIQRSYNSLDPRTDSAFGAGWASIVDAKATKRLDAAGNLQTVVLTYPGGQEVAFGANADNSFTPPLGRYSTLRAVGTTGYTLVDKDGTTYTFTGPTGVTGQYALSSVADAAGRTMTLAVDGNGRVTTITSAAGRSLTLTWATPAGTTTPHVATVTTDAAVPGVPATAATWTYGYSGDLLTQVCPPTSTTACTTYTYGTTTRYPNMVANLGPRSYWRLGDPAASTVATSAVADNGGTDAGSYVNVTLAQSTGPLAGSTATVRFLQRHHVGHHAAADRVEHRDPAELLGVVQDRRRRWHPAR
jgi:YD repeat-containing protein